jgi:hypothetical protein
MDNVMMMIRGGMDNVMRRRGGMDNVMMMIRGGMDDVMMFCDDVRAPVFPTLETVSAMAHWYGFVAGKLGKRDAAVSAEESDESPSEFALTQQVMDDVRQTTVELKTMTARLVPVSLARIRERSQGAPNAGVATETEPVEDSQPGVAPLPMNPASRTSPELYGTVKHSARHILLTPTGDIGMKLADERLRVSQSEFIQSWSALKVPSHIYMRMAQFGIGPPTRIQAATLQTINANKEYVGVSAGTRDDWFCATVSVIVQDETGTGKTIAYVVPAIMAVDNFEPKTQVVILVPTRDLVRTAKDEK